MDPSFPAQQPDFPQYKEEGSPKSHVVLLLIILLLSILFTSYILFFPR